MKKVILVVLILLFFVSCSKEENFELFSPEAFAYSLDSGWELNATVFCKGFSQKDKNDIYSSNLIYNISLVNPNQDTIKNFDNGNIEEESEENIKEMKIEVQAEMDSTFIAGKYFVIFEVKDVFSDKKATIKKEFDITKD